MQVFKVEENGKITMLSGDDAYKFCAESSADEMFVWRPVALVCVPRGTRGQVYITIEAHNITIKEKLS